MNEELQTPEQGTQPTENETLPENDPLEKALASTDESLAAAAKAKAEDEGVESPVPEPAPEQPDNEEEDQSEKTEADPAQPQTPAAPDYETKFKESAKEGILQHERVKLRDARIEQLTKTENPTDEELRAKYPWWDNAEVDEATRAFYRNDLIKEKRLARTENIALTLSEKLEYNEKLDDFIEDPAEEFKGLKGKEMEFKRFAKRKENIGIPIDKLAKAFLFDVKDELPKNHKPTPKPGLETGQGGPKTIEKAQALTPEQEMELMTKDPGRYAELVRKGVIK
jgi:hypothetical protein